MEEIDDLLKEIKDKTETKVNELINLVDEKEKLLQATIRKKEAEISSLLKTVTELRNDKERLTSSLTNIKRRMENIQEELILPHTKPPIINEPEKDNNNPTITPVIEAATAPATLSPSFYQNSDDSLIFNDVDAALMKRRSEMAPADRASSANPSFLKRFSPFEERSPRKKNAIAVNMLPVSDVSKGQNKQRQFYKSTRRDRIKKRLRSE